MRDPAEVNQTEFEEWYLMAHAKVLAALTAYSGDPAEASEATDEAFARAFLRWDRLQGLSSQTGWVFVVGRNLLRRRQWRSRLEAERWQRIASGRSAPHRDETDTVADASEIAQLLKPLSRRQRTAMILHHGLDLSQEQVASVMGVSRSTVASTLGDAKRALEGHSGGSACSEATELGSPVVSNERGPDV